VAGIEILFSLVAGDRRPAVGGYEGTTPPAWKAFRSRCSLRRRADGGYPALLRGKDGEMASLFLNELSDA